MDSPNGMIAKPVRCSSCSDPVKPVVALDIDGTLADYHGHFINFSTGYLQQQITRDPEAAYDGSELFREWWCRTFDQSARTWRDCKLAYRQGGMKRSQPIFAGAANMARAIYGAGAEVWITTTRPYMRLDNIDPDTRFWLEHWGIPFDCLLYDDEKYWQLAERVDKERVVAIIEDLPEQIDAAASIYGPHIPIQVHTLWNRGAFRPGVSNLEAAGAMVIDRVNLWREVLAH